MNDHTVLFAIVALLAITMLVNTLSVIRSTMVIIRRLDGIKAELLARRDLSVTVNVRDGEIESAAMEEPRRKKPVTENVH